MKAMSFFDYAKSLYSLDTLDKRLTTPSGVPQGNKVQLDPAKPTPSEDVKTRSSELRNGASPPLWKTPEFLGYYIVFLVCVPLMFKTVYDVSLRKSHQVHCN